MHESRWLTEEPKGILENLGVVLAFILFSLYHSLFVQLLALVVGVNREFPTQEMLLEEVNTVGLTYIIFGLFPIAALAEEIKNRLIPILLAWWLFKGDLTKMMAVAIVSSVEFGLAHDHSWPLAVHMIKGFVYSLIFVKYGGWRADVLKPLFVTTTLHWGWNTFALIMSQK